MCRAPREGASHKGRLCGNGPDTSDRIASKHLQVGWWAVTVRRGSVVRGGIVSAAAHT